MRVLDASVVVDAVAVAGPAGDRARDLVAGKPWLHLPSVAGAEVTSALRSMVRRGTLDAGVARMAAVRASRLRVRRYRCVAPTTRAARSSTSRRPWPAGDRSAVDVAVGLDDE